MKTFLRAIDWVLVRVFCLAALGTAIAFIANQAEYDRLAYQMQVVQASALIEIANALHGTRL
jgi:hypothetical protein